MRLKQSTKDQIIKSITKKLPNLNDRLLLNIYSVIFYPVYLGKDDYEETGKPELVRK